MMKDSVDLIRVQYDLEKRLEKCLSNHKKTVDPARRTKSYFEKRILMLTSIYNEFNDNHHAILSSNVEDEDPYYKDDLPDNFEETYLKVYSQITDDFETAFPPSPPEPIQPPPPPANNVVMASTPGVKLPKLNLPMFSGKYTDWQSFHNIFNRLIHQHATLSRTEKFHYLHSSLSDEARKEIRHLEIIDTNYLIAYNLLQSRYNNKRILFTHTMNLLTNQPCAREESASCIKSLLDTSRSCVNSLKQLDLPIDECDQLIVHILLSKLSKSSHQLWEQTLGIDAEIPTFARFTEFLEIRLRTLESMEFRSSINKISITTSSNNKSFNNKSSFKTKSNIFHTTKNDSSSQNQPSAKCSICNEAHHVRRCPSFLALDCFERKVAVDKAKLCLNCLNSSHNVSSCISTKNCHQCGKRHHTLIHFPKNTSSSSSSSSPNSTSPSNNSSTNHIVATSAINSNDSTSSAVQVILATALVWIVNNHHVIQFRALIDPGSEITLITERAVQMLGLKKRSISAKITAVGDPNPIQESKYITSCVIKSCIDNNFCIQTNALVLKHLTNKLPTTTINPKSWMHINDLELADPTFYRTGAIDLIIGADLYPQIILDGLRRGVINEPIAQRSNLGWILSGPVLNNTSLSRTLNSFHLTSDLNQIVQKYFEMEDINDNAKVLSNEDVFCESFFQTTHKRQPNGKYLVRLPIKSIFDSTLTLGKSKYMATKRLYHLESKLNNNPELSNEYSKSINDYFDLNQLSISTKSEEQHHTYNQHGKSTYMSCYLPHHAVIKDTSTTTKVRIVFDASSLTSHGTSLNDLLCIGPPLQTDLPAVILNWRLFKFVFTADIQKMYRCIDMHPDDISYQQILWRNNTGEVTSYCLNTVTFGTASAPYTAIRVLHQLAEDEKDQFPLASNVLKNEIYIDDIYTGHHTINDALLIRDQVMGALTSAGFHLRKWASNHNHLLKDIPTEHQTDSTALQFDSSVIIKTLGISWQPNNDSFTFQINFPTYSKIITKRFALSIIAKIFDPLGFISPVTIVGKILYKRIWQSGTDWDEPINPDLQIEWSKYSTSLQQINKIHLSRFLQYSPSTKSIELHAFCDGSINAYACVVYLRFKNYSNQYVSNLLVSKTKVTPTKSLTIPRVELCAAVLGTRLVNWVLKQIAIPIDNIQAYYWTDATIILSWIKSDKKQPVFVANRLKTIQTHTNPNQWHHISTHENPADCATRGLTPEKLATFELWFHGPSWLTESNCHWPSTTWTHLDSEDNLVNNIPCFHISNNKTLNIISKFSSLVRLRRIIALLLRFIKNCRLSIQNRQHGHITVEEWNNSLSTLIRMVQLECFPSEISCVSSNRPLSHKNKLIGLAPFIDNDNILRVRGRLQRSNLCYTAKHPAILPSPHHFTTLLIRNCHISTLHGGTQLVLSQIRKQFWILNARRTIQTEIKKCVTCFRHRPQISNQLMGNLPTHRVNPPSRPFSSIGIDCTGAILLRASKYRGNTTYKGYIVLFICLSTKAVHLEIVTGMSTDHFIWAFQRFVGRRGMCADIYTDHGTNFYGANSTFIKTIKETEQAIRDDILPKLTILGIKWHFIPPASPTFGGLWESNIKSMKHHLKRVTKGALMTYEELSTVLIRIESCLNSRPLCPMTSDPDDLNVLTPGHFLIGDSLICAPETPIINYPPTRRYQIMQSIIHQFWSHWSSDWLSHLQNRPKWCHQQANLNINDIVLVKDDRLPPNQWIIGKIIKAIPGMDGLNRVFIIKTQHGEYKRSIHKLCKLPIPTYTEASTDDI